MTRKDIEEHLRKRIEETRAWTIYDQKSVTENWKLRGSYPAQLIPLSFIEDPERIEAHGMRFRVVFGDDRKQFYCNLDVRIRPYWISVKDGTEEAAYVHICVPDVPDSSISWIKFKEDGSNLGEDLHLVKWYEKWVMLALNDNKKCTKIFKNKKPLPGEL